MTRGLSSCSLHHEKSESYSTAIAEFQRTAPSSIHLVMRNLLLAVSPKTWRDRFHDCKLSKNSCSSTLFIQNDLIFQLIGSKLGNSKSGDGGLFTLHTLWIYRTSWIIRQCQTSLFLQMNCGLSIICSCSIKSNWCPKTYNLGRSRQVLGWKALKV